jgi:hypothetical protein
MAENLFVGSDSPASVFMNVLGQIAKTSGLAISSASLMFLGYSILGFGCTVLQFLPKLAATGPTTSFIDDLSEKNAMNLKSFFFMVTVFFGGVVLRGFGARICHPENIRRVEEAVYGGGNRPANHRRND